MWELYTGQRAYGGLGRDAIIDRVYKKKARPVFPLGVPPTYAALAKGCWDNDQNARPAFLVVIARLTEMLEIFQNASNTQAMASAAPGTTAGGSSNSPVLVANGASPGGAP